MAFSYNNEIANVFWLIRKVKRICEYHFDYHKDGKVERFDVGYRVINYLFRLRDNVLQETYRLLNLIDEWCEECEKKNTEEEKHLTQGKIVILIAQSQLFPLIK